VGECSAPAFPLLWPLLFIFLKPVWCRSRTLFATVTLAITKYVVIVTIFLVNFEVNNQIWWLVAMRCWVFVLCIMVKNQTCFISASCTQGYIFSTEFPNSDNLGHIWFLHGGLQLLSHCSALVLWERYAKSMKKGSGTPEVVFLKFGKNDYLSHAIPRAKNDGRLKRGMAWGYRWSGQVACLFIFFYFFSSFNASTAYNEKRGLTLNAPKNVFWW